MPERHVLLIDEIDKADLEFPNDLLRELDEMRFTIIETSEEIVAKSHHRSFPSRAIENDPAQCGSEVLGVRVYLPADGSTSQTALTKGASETTAGMPLHPGKEHR